MNKSDISHVYIAADHRGVGLKLYLYEMLMAAGYNVVNLGTDDVKTPVDFPDIAKKLADFGIDLIIGNHPYYVQPVSYVYSNKGNKVFVKY